jgi:NAD(P)-dependent dehydrogenase (short-subunit alcohol dehydrogenase family)
VQEILDSENRIDILVNDAGVDFIRSATEMTLGRVGPRPARQPPRPLAALARRLPAHGRARRGQIVNVSSTASKKGWPNATAYAASKHGVMGLTQALHAAG